MSVLNASALWGCPPLLAALTGPALAASTGLPLATSTGLPLATSTGLPLATLAGPPLATLAGPPLATLPGPALAASTGSGTLLAMLGALLLIGAIEGTMLSMAQYLVLRRRLPRLHPREWLGPAITLAVLGWLIGLGGPLLGPVMPSGLGTTPLPNYGLSAALGASLGLVFGAVQWLLLRRHAERAVLWIVAYVPAWAAALAAMSFGVLQASARGMRWPMVSGGIAGGLLAAVILLLLSLLPSLALRPWVSESPQLLRGKVAAITGANDGIGYEIAKGLARLGASVVLLCRDEIRGAAAASAIRISMRGAEIRTVVCDLEQLGSVRTAAARLAAELPRLDILIHNAGATFAERTTSPDGIESTLAIDVVGPFLLTTLLREKLDSCAGRVITLADLSHYAGQIELADLHFVRREYDEQEANAQAQRGRVLITAELARRAPRLRAVAVHPGAVWTRTLARAPALTRWLVATVLRPRVIRAELGALPILRVAVQPAAELPSGRFWNRFKLDAEVPDSTFAQAFYSACEKMTNKSSDS